MKKIIIGVVAALVLLYPAIAWLVGSFIEHRFDASIELMRENAPYATVVEHHFRRGWYTSQQDVTLELLHGALKGLPGAMASAGGPDTAASGAGAGAGAATVSGPGPFRITIRSVIHHGPICGVTCFGLARVDSRVEFSAPIQSAVARIFGSAEPISARSRLGFLGGASIEIQSPAFPDTSLADGARVAWGGLAGTIEYGADYDSGEIRLTAPRILFSSADGRRAELSALAFNSDTKRMLRLLHVGDSSLTIGRIALAGPGGATNVTVNDISSASHSSADQGYLTVTVNTSTGAIVTAPLTLSGVHFDFTFRHLEMESLERMEAAVQRSIRIRLWRRLTAR